MRQSLFSASMSSRSMPTSGEVLETVYSEMCLDGCKIENVYRTERSLGEIRSYQSALRTDGDNL